MKNEQLAIKETLSVVFSLHQFDHEFIESVKELKLVDYFTNLDLDDCDLTEAYDKTWLVCKNGGMFVLTALLSTLPKRFLEFSK